MRRMTALLALAVTTGIPVASARPGPLKVLVWDEQQDAQKKAYENFLGNHIAEHLGKQEGIEVKSANIKEAEQGLSDVAIDSADVIVWWGHVRHKDVNDAKVQRIVDRVKAGKCGLVAVHSAHYSKPFKAVMFERFKQDVLKQKGLDASKVEFVKEKKEGKPEVVKEEEVDGKKTITVVPPNCGLGGWRADGMPSHVETKLPDHPIAKGLPAKFDIKQTEMYNEAFTVPEPDAVVFFETWDKGEKFRAGCCWQVGEGRVFYFRPGHETYPVFHQEETLKIVHNAALWVGKRT